MGASSLLALTVANRLMFALIDVLLKKTRVEKINEMKNTSEMPALRLDILNFLHIVANCSMPRYTALNCNPLDVLQLRPLLVLYFVV